jgi:hypothetical protein
MPLGGVKWLRGTVSHTRAWGEAFEHTISALGRGFETPQTLCSSDAEYRDLFVYDLFINEPLICK